MRAVLWTGMLMGLGWSLGRMGRLSGVGNLGGGVVWEGEEVLEGGRGEV